jgi:A/G-specific adenine glycosylase
MSEVPTTGWTSRTDGIDTVDGAPFPAAWRATNTITHVFTHFTLELNVFRTDMENPPPPSGHWWASAAAIHSEALPTVMKKAIEAAIPGVTRRTPHSREG